MNIAKFFAPRDSLSPSPRHSQKNMQSLVDCGDVFFSILNRPFGVKACDLLDLRWGLEKSFGATKFRPGPLYIYFNLYYNALYI